MENLTKLNLLNTNQNDFDKENQLKILFLNKKRLFCLKRLHSLRLFFSLNTFSDTKLIILGSGNNPDPGKDTVHLMQL